MKNPQKLHLQAERQLANLIEKQGSARGFLEQPFAVAVGVGKGPLAVSKQLRFQQTVGNGAAVDGDESVGSAGRNAVDSARDQLLTRARLSPDQHRGLELGDLAYSTKQVEHLPAGRHQIPKSRIRLLPPGPNLSVQRLVLAEKPFTLFRLAQKQESSSASKGFEM